MVDFSKASRSKSRSIVERSARDAVRQAMSCGRWVAAADACIDKDGRTSIAWGVFDPQGRLAASGSEIISLTEARSTTQAEAFGALRSLAEADLLGAPSALCLCDCAPAVQRLQAADAADELSSRFEAISKGRFEVKWVGRDALGPANDMARKALGLRPEKAAQRHWGPWFEKMSAASEPARLASP